MYKLRKKNNINEQATMKIKKQNFDISLFCFCDLPQGLLCRRGGSFLPDTNRLQFPSCRVQIPLCIKPFGCQSQQGHFGFVSYLRPPKMGPAIEENL